MTLSDHTADSAAERIDEILDRFAKWTITSVEHGIYIPLPSPETKAALLQLIEEVANEAASDELIQIRNIEWSVYDGAADGTVVGVLLEDIARKIHAHIDDRLAALRAEGK
jgi:hypothetical protein